MLIHPFSVTPPGPDREVRSAAASRAPATEAHGGASPFAAMLNEAAARVSRADAAQAAADAADISGLPDWIRQMSQSLHESNGGGSAEKLVRDMALVPHGALVDISARLDGLGPVYYTATGALVTPESEAYFETMSRSVLAGRADLYERETALGTPPADIFDKMALYMSRQPGDYLDMMNWSGKPAARPAAPR